MSFFNSNDASLLLVEVDGFVHPSLESIGDFLYSVDHGGNLDVQPFSKESLYFWSISCLGLCNQVLEFGEVCLKTMIFSSWNLFEVIKFVSGHLCLVVWIEHVGESLFCLSKSLSATLMFESARISNQVSAK